MTSNNDSEFSWGALGELWWRENGAATRATEKQIIFACARHQGATQAVSAKWAGYAGSGEELRAAGSNAEGRTAVQDLLTLAQAAETGVDESIATAAEIDKKLTRLIRSPDGSISLKAVEAWERREKSKRDRGETPSDDGLAPWRAERDMVALGPDGACAYLHLFRAVQGDLGHVGNLCLLHDTHHVLMQHPLGRALWQHDFDRISEPLQADLRRHLADPGWQLDARRKIWGEIGKQPPAPISAVTTDSLEAPDAA
jgi:hypothetical protein